MSSDTDSAVYTPPMSSQYSTYAPQDEGVWSMSWSETWNLSYCPCCRPGYGIKEYQEATNFPFGHLLPQEYADFRASSRDKQRERKMRPERGCNSYKCRKSGQEQQRTKNRKKKVENVRFSVLESQKEVPCYTRGFFNRTKHHFVEWDLAPEEGEELDPWLYDMPDAMVRHLTVHHSAAVFEKPEPYVEFGERFPAWCQRRIAEMRTVKENRIRRGEPESFKPMLLKRQRAWPHSKQYNVYCGDESTTTQPTNAYDALGHQLLRAVLSPVAWYRKPMRFNNASLFRPNNDYRWFGEFAWAWHRNASGCWELGYDGHCDDGPDMDYGCFCRQETYLPALDETQRCSLVEWMVVKRKAVMLEEAREPTLQDSIGDAELSESEDDHGWDVVSIASAESWSIVDVDAN